MRLFYSRAPHTNSIILVFDFIRSTTILGWRSVCFARCLPAHLMAAVALFILYLGQNHAWR